jgi:single-strand DNA-binding protein
MEFTGRITADAKINVVKGGKEVVNFSLAINDRYRAKGSTESKEFTTYIEVAWWMHTGIAKVLRKGAIVSVSGRIYPRAYQDLQGNPKANINCHADKITLIQVSKYATVEQVPETIPQTEPVDDLPF